MRSGNRREAGFTYLWLLVALAVMGLVASNSLSAGAAMSRIDAEQELLVIGAEYERALDSYRVSTPVGIAGRNPMRLEDLLLDRRAAVTRRHLRKVYVDPLTGSDEWGIERAPDGSVAGVFSMAEGEPIQQTGFGDRWSAFNGQTHYSNWIFGLEVQSSLR